MHHWRRPRSAGPTSGPTSGATGAASVGRSGQSHMGPTSGTGACGGPLAAGCAGAVARKDLVEQRQRQSAWPSQMKCTNILLIDIHNLDKAKAKRLAQADEMHKYLTYRNLQLGKNKTG